MLAELQIPCLISKLKVQSLDKQTPKLFTEFFYHSVNNERQVRDSTKEQTRSEETQPKSKLEAKRLNQEQTRSEETQPRAN